MVRNLKNGNLLSVGEINSNEIITNFTLTIQQKDGNWKTKERVSFPRSMYDSINDYLNSHYEFQK